MKKRIASDLMTRDVITVSAQAKLTDAIEVLLRHKVSFLPVVDEARRLLGVITEYDIINFALSGEAGNTRVEEAMTREVVAFAPDTDLETLVNCCVTRRIHRAPVVQDGKVVGLIGRRDILREMLRMYRNE